MTDLLRSSTRRGVRTTSRYSFFHLAELFRLGMAREEGHGAPVLTLPVGGP